MKQHQRHSPLGWWQGRSLPCAGSGTALQTAIYALKQPVYLLEQEGQFALGIEGCAVLGNRSPAPDALPLIGYTPPCDLKNLGDPAFCADYGLEYPYMAGAMANGCTSAEIVAAMGQNGMLGDFGAAGLSLTAIAAAIDRISRNLQTLPYCFNLIHSPNEPNREAAVVELYLRRGVRLVSASAYLGLTLPVVRYRVQGIQRNAAGQIITPNRLIAKVSRVEVAAQFFAPPPERFLRELAGHGEITPEQAQLATQIPMAQDVIAEADSGGHTDNRPALTLFPTMLALRDRLQAHYRYAQKLRVGAGGGIATPASAAAAFAMGAAFLVTGSVNQACIESGTSDLVRHMLSEAGQSDVMMAPAADMFEMGVKVQVLKRGTMFPMRAGKLYDLYRNYDSLAAIPAAERELVETKFFQCSFDVVWEQTQRYFQERDPAQIERARREPKYRMALVFRWYLGQSSRWPMAGDPARKMDYQIWCGPAIGAFNEWVKGSFLEPPQQRQVVTVALNLLYGAGIISRVNALRAHGIRLPPEFANPAPLTLAALRERL